MSPTHAIHDERPAGRWEDAFLSGNGESGIMIFGHPHRERIVHNHHRYVLPNGSLQLRPPEVAERLERVRDLILDGEREQAQREFSDGRGLAWTQPFHPGHVLHLDSDADIVADAFEDYRRTTTFDSGEITVSWSDAAGRWTRRAFVSRADSVAVVELAGSGPLDLSLHIAAGLPGQPRSVGFSAAAHVVGAGEALLSGAGTYPDAGSSALGFIGVTRLVAIGGEITAEGDTIRVHGAARVTLLTRMDRPHTTLSPEDTAKPLFDLPAEYDLLLARHLPIHRALYSAADLKLTSAETSVSVSVSELIDRAHTQTDAIDPLLAETLFRSGRYLLLSSTGVLPPRLTGLWLADWDAAWSGDFTTDANVNMQVAPLVLTGMSDLIKGYVALIADQIEDWRANARAIYGARGILAPSRTDGEHGLLFHLDDEWPWQMWVAGADWMLYPLHEYWQATGDDAFLADTLAPWLIDAAVFFEDFLTRTDEQGRRVIVPSYSPEIGPCEVRGVAGVNAAMDIAAAAHALSIAAEACTHLGIEPDSVERWRSLAAELPPYRIDDRGALAEFSWPGLETAEDHRHISHLYPVWPLHVITPDQTPDLAAAARRALLNRGDENLSAHGSLHRALCAARLRDTDTTRVNLLKILGRDMLYRSLMTSHNPGLETYNADAAHTLPAVFVEMLVDSRPGRIELLPAPPDEWPGGRLNGISTRTGVTIDELAWDAETVRVTLTSQHEQTVTVVHRGTRQELRFPGTVTLQL